MHCLPGATQLRHGSVARTIPATSCQSASLGSRVGQSIAADRSTTRLKQEQLTCWGFTPGRSA